MIPSSIFLYLQTKGIPKGTSQALRDLFSRLICTKQQSNGIIIYAAPPSTLLYISTISLKFEDGPPISVILRGNIYTFR